jgi:RNA polymerase sigma-70 factor (ECF subfamily)
MVDQPTSLSLLQRVREQRQDAWSQLVFLYAPLVEHWCRGWGVPGADVDDLRQEVFHAVVTGLESFRRDRLSDTFRGWLRVITYRKFLDFCRRKQHHAVASGGTDAQRRLEQVPEVSDVPTEDPPEELRRLHHRALELVHSSFEEQTWQAFWRTAVEGQAPVDVAQDMRMTPAAVRKAKSRVLRRLKEELGDLLG